MIHLFRRPLSHLLVRRLTAHFHIESLFEYDATAPQWGSNSHTESECFSQLAESSGESRLTPRKLRRERRKKAESLFEKS